MADRLIVRGAREHNLKDVSLDLPRDALIVFTGLSGSGKSSLAFDTIFAEGQRRYVESLSAYARQFLGPDGQARRRLHRGAVARRSRSTRSRPAATRARRSAPSPRSTTTCGCCTPASGKPHCPICGEPIARQTPQQIVDRVLELDEGTRFQVLAPVIRGRKGEYVELFRELQAKGFARARVDGVVDPLTARSGDAAELKKQEKHTSRSSSTGSRSSESARAAAHRLGRDRAAAWPAASWCSTSSTCAETDPHRERDVLRAAGLPERPPVHRRARAALVLVQLALRRLPGLHRPRHPDGGRPRAGRPRPGLDAGRGRDRAVVAAATSATTSCG